MDRLRLVLVVRKGQAGREHFFKECIVWKKEIRTLWKEVGEISGNRISRATETDTAMEE